MPARSDVPVGEWRYTQLRTNYSERSQWLDEHVPGWRGHLSSYAGSALTFAWLERANEFLDFISEHGRVPTRKDGRIGDWRHSQLQTPCLEKRKWLDEHTPGWDVNHRSTDSPPEYSPDWLDKAQEFAAFFKLHGRPSENSELERWRRWQKYSVPPGSRHAWLDKNAPGWRTGNQTPASVAKKRTRPALTSEWLSRAHEFRLFVAENGRVPVRTDGALGEWRYKQIRRARPRMASRFI